MLKIIVKKEILCLYFLNISQRFFTIIKIQIINNIISNNLYFYNL